MPDCYSSSATKKYIGNCEQDRGQKVAIGGRNSSVCVSVCVRTHASIMVFLDISQVITVNQTGFQDL